jgi:hypothetical protein
MIIIILNGYKKSTLNMKKWLEKWGKIPTFDEYGMIQPF